MVGCQYSFVKKYLSHQKTKLFLGDKQILVAGKNVLNSYEVAPLVTEITLGQDFLEDETTQRISYAALRRMGYCIIKQDIKNEEWMHGSQRVGLKITKLTSEVAPVDYTSIRQHQIMYNPKHNAVRLIGKNAIGSRPGIGEWVIVKRQRDTSIDTSPSSWAQQLISDEPMVDYSQQHIGSWMGQMISPKKKTANIPEVAFMVNTENELVCLQKSGDMQKIGAVGDTGTGKSLLLCRVLVQQFYKWQKDWYCILNDCLGQFHELARPQLTEKFNKELYKFGEAPVPLPIINLFMGAPDMQLFNEEEGISYRYVQEFKTFLNLYKYMTYGIEGFRLKGSERYLDTYKPFLQKCQTKDEIKDALFKNTPDEKTRENLKAMFMKWSNTFGDIFRYKFLDVNYSNGTVCPNWKVVKEEEEYVGNPIISCMKAGILPTLNTNYAKDHSYFRNLLAYTLRQILEYQKMHRYTEQRRVWVVLDEIADLFKYSRREDNLYQVFSEIFVQGRGQNIGCLYSTTNFKSLPDNVKQNTSTLICTQIHKDAASRTDIKKSFDLDKGDVEQLIDLNPEKREIVAFQNKPFVVYDRDGRRKVGRTMYRGYLIPPNCNTYHPE